MESLSQYRFSMSGMMAIGFLVLFCLSKILMGAGSVPTEIEQPGTQPLEVAAPTSPDNCDNCHGGTSNPNFEPDFGWRGGMMANATRDPLFWATLAIAEQDFLPGSVASTRGGAGDLCLRCHSVSGWLNGNSTPTDGSGLGSTENNGVDCEFCHLLVNPDLPVNVTGTVEMQNAPYLAHDESTGTAYLGTGQYVMNAEGTRLGPYTTTTANHQFYASPFHRQGELCSTCHDVSNPAVGDLSPNNGAQVPLLAGTYSGVVGSAVDEKAAFNNPPSAYGIVERTSSEWFSSAFDTMLVNDFSTLPMELRNPAGSLSIAYHRSADATANANYVDGTPRYYTCQTCHMAASTGVGCNKPSAVTRTDLPRHDQTGASHWMPDVLQYMDAKGTLLFGGGLTQKQKDALNAGKQRAQDMLRSAAALEAQQIDAELVVRVTNLTAHKLISGYPEGRRLWLNIRWLDAGSEVIGEQGSYGPIGRSITDLNGISHAVQSIVDPGSTVIYEVHPGIDQAWADRLINDFGYPASMVLSYDRLSDSVVHTLGDLSLTSPGTAWHTFHFVLNNAIVEDIRIPPYGFDYDLARGRNCLPVPADQFGNPGPGGTYNHWDDVAFTIPDGAVAAQIRLYYQQTSWEYIQFLWLHNDKLSPFLGNEGDNLLDAWANTGMCAPVEIAFSVANNLTPPIASPPGEASHQFVPAEQMRVTFLSTTDELQVVYTPACAATGHTLYYGSLVDVQSLTWSGAECLNDTTGSMTITAPPESIFFTIVGYNDSGEGSFGLSSAGIERLEAPAVGSCNFPQDLSGTCDPLKRSMRLSSPYKR